jgi:P pilus assembly chaperone PapD
MMRRFGTTMFGAVKAGRALIVLASALFMGATDLAAQLSVDELEIFIDPSSPTARTGVVRVTNDTDKPVQALLDVQDWNRDPTGANQFYKLGSKPGSCADKLKVFPASLRVEARSTEPVRVTFEGDAAASCWGVVFIQASEPPKPSGTQSSITYVIRTGVKVYVQAANALRQGDVDSVRITRASKSATDSTKVPAIEVHFRNTGQAHMKPVGAVEVRSADNNVAAKIDITEFPIAPGDSRRIILALPAIQKGRYIALALVDYGGAEIAAAQLEFEIN